MSPTIEVKGIKALEERLGNLTPEVAVAVRKQINAGAMLIRNSAIKSIKRKTGAREVTRYFGSGRKRTVKVSAPNTAPNDDTGNLRKHIIISKGENIITKGYTALIRSTAKYAKALEFGVPKRNLVKRPYMKPALKGNALKISNNIKKAALKALKL